MKVRVACSLPQTRSCLLQGGPGVPISSGCSPCCQGFCVPSFPSRLWHLPLPGGRAACAVCPELSLTPSVAASVPMCRAAGSCRLSDVCRDSMVGGVSKFPLQGDKLLRWSATLPKRSYTWWVPGFRSWGQSGPQVLLWPMDQVTSRPPFGMGFGTRQGSATVRLCARGSAMRAAAGR